MSEQGKILKEMQNIIMNIMKNSSASVEESNRIDELEKLLLEQNSYIEIDHPKHTYIGEEIAELLINNNYDEAIDKMYQYDITSKDFFGFINYHDEDEEFYDIFTDEFKDNINNLYKNHKK